MPSVSELSPLSSANGVSVRGVSMRAAAASETPEGNGKTPPALGGESMQPRPLGRAEAFAQRFHREGLPVARLWENHSALISLGLNQKGKPGLWLVQKTH
jgi:hypothetical protein